MADLSDFHPYILPEVPQCPLAVVDFAISNTLNDFCTATRLWSAELDPMDSVANQMDYTVTPPTDSELVRLERVSYDGHQLKCLTLDQLDLIYRSSWLDLTGTPIYYVLTGTETLSLVPAPAAALTDGITIRVSLTPAPDATTFPDLFFRRYSAEIAAGAKAALMSMVDKPWSNQEAATRYGALYAAGRDDGMTFKAKGHLGARTRTAASYF
jgi:hypothetical protein